MSQYTREQIVEDALSFLASMADDTGRIPTKNSRGVRRTDKWNPATEDVWDRILGTRRKAHLNSPLTTLLRESGIRVPVVQIPSVPVPRGLDRGPSKTESVSALDNLVFRDGRIVYDDKNRQIFLDKYNLRKEQNPTMTYDELIELMRGSKEKQMFFEGMIDRISGELPPGLRSIDARDMVRGPVDAETGVLLQPLGNIGDIYLGGTTPGALYLPNDRVLERILGYS